MTAYKVAVGGQSFVPFLLGGPGGAAIANEFARAGHTVSLYGNATQGAGLLKSQAPSGFPNNYFWDEDNDVPGPGLTSWQSVINSLPSGTLPINRLIWAQGEGCTPPGTPFSGTDFVTYTGKVIDTMRATLNPSSPASVGVIIVCIGRRIRPDPMVEWELVQEVREAQHAFIDADAAVFGCDPYYMPLLGDDPRFTSPTNDTNNSHMDTLGQAMFGYQAIQRIMVSFLLSSRMQPSVASVTRDDADTVRLTFSSSGGLVKPEAPAHFAVRDSGGSVTLYGDLLFEWDGDELLITDPSGIGGTLLYPYGDLHYLDKDGLITNVHGAALASGVWAIPA